MCVRNLFLETAAAASVLLAGWWRARALVLCMCTNLDCAWWKKEEEEEEEEKGKSPCAAYSSGLVPESPAVKTGANKQLIEADH